MPEVCCERGPRKVRSFVNTGNSIRRVFSGFVGAVEDVGDAEPAWFAGFRTELRNDIAGLRNGAAKSFNSSAYVGPHALVPLQGMVAPYALPVWFPADVSAFLAMTAAQADDLMHFYALAPVALAAGAAPEGNIASKRAVIAAHVGYRGV